MVFSSLLVTDYIVLNVDSSLNISSILNITDVSGIKDDWRTPVNLENTEDQANPINTAEAAKILHSAISGTFENLTSSRCMNEYTNPFPTTWGDVVVVSESIPGSDLQPVLELRQWGYVGIRPWTRCTYTYNNATDCSNDDRAFNKTNWSPYGSPVKYCLSRPVPQVCRLYFNTFLAVAVLVSNLVKMCAFLYIAWSLTEEPLFVLGDAIRSFLMRPDANSKWACLVPSEDITDVPRGHDLTKARAHSKVRKRWLSSISAGKRVFGILG